MAKDLRARLDGKDVDPDTPFLTARINVPALLVRADDLTAMLERS